jgi:hypothetical protein
MKTAKTNRRKFLLAAGLGGAGVAAAVVTARRDAGKTVAAETAREAQPSGYRVSEHILKYYKTTEV